MAVRSAPKFKQPRCPSKLEDPVHTEVLLVKVRKSDFSIADEKRGLSRIRGRFDLDVSLSAILIERQNVVSRAVAANLRRVLDPVCESILAALYEAPALVVHDEFFTG